ncbi:MAG: M48 family metallopeptidase [Bdellovibrionales bacterium]|nr:M48 family metallopeptidase [Bdellovibrionales bacterium]
MKTLIVTILAANLLIDLMVELLNLKSFPNTEQYKRRRSYFQENMKVGFAEQGVQFLFWIVAFQSPFFERLDLAIGSVIQSTIWKGAVWLIAISAIRALISFPFQAFSTFSTESRFGFNKTTVQTFFADRIKGALLGVTLGLPILALLLYIFQAMGPNAWWMCWLILTGLSLVMGYLAPALILPLFNRFESLPEGSLRSSIEAYARKEDFPMGGTFVMDGSKRSTKRNAFFTGFGKLRKLVLFDTLIANHEPDEILAVVAHEMGHFKCGHIPKMILLSVLTQGLLFWILGRFLTDPRAPVWIQQTLGLSEYSLAGAFLLMSILYLPISRVLSIGLMALSRKHEYEADDYSKRTFGKSAALVSALRKMETDHLAHPSPHWLKVLLEYSHPPVDLREKALISETQI